MKSLTLSFFFFQAGCVPMQRNKETKLLEVMMIKSKTKTDWMFPKGSVHQNEPEVVAAERETIEEAGVSGEMGSWLGEWESPKNPNKIHNIWLLIVGHTLEDSDPIWKERFDRKRKWFTVEECRAQILKDGFWDKLEKMLDEAVKAFQNDKRTNRS